MTFEDVVDYETQLLEPDHHISNLGRALAKAKHRRLDNEYVDVAKPIPETGDDLELGALRVDLHQARARRRLS